jgi:hypothetical protein
MRQEARVERGCEVSMLDGVVDPSFLPALALHPCAAASNVIAHHQNFGQDACDRHEAALRHHKHAALFKPPYQPFLAASSATLLFHRALLQYGAPRAIHAARNCGRNLRRLEAPRRPRKQREAHTHNFRPGRCEAAYAHQRLPRFVPPLLSFRKSTTHYLMFTTVANLCLI